MPKRAFESPGGEDRGATLAATGDPGAISVHGVYVAAEESGALVLDRLLAGLAIGNLAAADALIRFAPDARVAPALVAALQTAPPWSLAIVAPAVGLVAGDGAAAALRERLPDAVRARAKVDGTAVFDWTAGALASVAAALLRLDPANADAQAALASLHPLLDQLESLVRGSLAADAPALRLRACDQLRYLPAAAAARLAAAALSDEPDAGLRALLATWASAPS